MLFFFSEYFTTCLLRLFRYLVVLTEEYQNLSRELKKQQQQQNQNPSCLASTLRP